MAEPIHVELGEILKIMAGSALAAVSSVMAWWRGHKAAIYHRISEVEEKAQNTMKEIERVASMQTTKIAVLEAHQMNNVVRLEELKEEAQNANRKLDDLQSTLTDVLVAIQSRRGA